MPVSPADFALWARATGNKYPETAEEKLAAAPHAYDYVKNVGKVGENAPGPRVGGNILYDRPVAVQNSSPDSLFNAPVTPDNRASKVAGTLDNSLTSEHFQNDEENEAIEHQEQHALLHTVGKAALAAGAVAASLAVARTPGGRQALNTANTVLKENTQNIGERASSFLRGLGAGRNSDPDVIRNSGEVNPQTTAERFNQYSVPTATQEIQVAKGSPVGSPAAETLPPTTESYATKPVTESDLLTSSQTFGPQNKSEIIQSVLNKMPLSAAESEYKPDILDPRDLSGKSFQLATKYASPAVIAARREAEKIEVARRTSQFATPRQENYQMEIPGVNPTRMALLSKEAGVSPQDAGIYQAPETGSTISPTTEQYSLLSQTPDPWTGKYTPTAQALDLGEQTSRLMPSVEPTSLSKFKPSAKLVEQIAEQSQLGRGTSGFKEILTSRTGYGAPVRHEVVAAPKLGGKSLVRVMGGGEQPTTVSIEQPYTYDPSEQRSLEEFATSGARDVTGAFLKEQVQKLPGARDVEAAIATQEAQGALPSGRYSSLVSGEEFEPAWGASSMIDPRIVTAGGQGVSQNVTPELSGAVQQLGTLKETEQDRRGLTFLKQVTALHDITQDPALIEAGSQGAFPINVTLPGGETVPTRSFFKPHGAVGAGEGSNLTQVQALEGNVIGKQTTLGNVKAGILRKFGLGPTDRITNNMFNQLSQPERNTLVNASNALSDAQTRLNAAKENQILFSIPENILEGTKSAPVISQATGEVVGMTAVPEEKAIYTPEF